MFNFQANTGSIKKSNKSATEGPRSTKKSNKSAPEGPPTFSTSPGLQFGNVTSANLFGQPPSTNSSIFPFQSTSVPSANLSGFSFKPTTSSSFVFTKAASTASKDGNSKSSDSSSGFGPTTSFGIATTSGSSPSFNSSSGLGNNSPYLLDSEAGKTSNTYDPAFKFEPPTDQDTLLENETSATIETRHQCITAMKVYEDKSIEELRYEDWAVKHSDMLKSRTCMWPESNFKKKLCEVHFSEEVEFYCNDCSVPMCKKCLITCHRQHDFDGIKTSVEKEAEKLRSVLAGIETERLRLKQELKRVCQKIDEQTIQFCHAIMKIADEAKTRVEKSVDETEKTFLATLEDINVKLTKMGIDSVDATTEEEREW